MTLVLGRIVYLISVFDFFGIVEFVLLLWLFSREGAVRCVRSER